MPADYQSINSLGTTYRQHKFVTEISVPFAGRADFGHLVRSRQERALARAAPTTSAYLQKQSRFRWATGGSGWWRPAFSCHVARYARAFETLPTNSVVVWFRFKWPSATDAQRNAKGSTVPRLRRDYLDRCPIKIPGVGFHDFYSATLV
jgi:hypothetical protein